MQKYNKAIVAATGAIAQGVAALSTCTDPRIQLLLAVVTAFGVYQVPNKK